MRTTFFDRETKAMIDLQPDVWGRAGKVFTVNRVSVPPSTPSNRGKGVASRLFAEVCTEADHEGITLALVIIPDDTQSDSLTREQLEAWYRRLGFTTSQTTAPWWTRPPNPEGPA